MRRAVAFAAAAVLVTSTIVAFRNDADAGRPPSSRKGSGANVYAGGTTFRVWAPHADRVFVTGDFDGWNESADELGREAGGVFSADVPGAVAGQKYEFVIVHGSDTFHKADPRARRAVHSAGASIIVDPSTYKWSAKSQAFRPAPRNEQVIYEMHIGTFNVTDTSRPGTFASAAAKLDALSDLGVNMIELLPPAEFPGDYSWGYNPSLPFAPESAYGAPDDLRALVDAAHARGIGVLIDIVFNHLGPADLALWRFDGDAGAGGPSGDDGGIYFGDGARGKTEWGPRPDFSRKEVRAYIADCARMWLEEYRCDGFRWDSTQNIRRFEGAPWKEGEEMLRAINAESHAIKPAKTLIAEDFLGDDGCTRPVENGGTGFDAQWDGGFFHPIDDAILAARDEDRHMDAVKGAIEHAMNKHGFERVIYTESHDEVANGKHRIPQTIDPANPASFAAEKRSTLGAAIALTSPGIPMLFQGQELLEDGEFGDRRPIDWTKATTHAGIRALYRDLIALRTNRARTTRGLCGEHVRVLFASEKDKVIAYHRFDQGGPGDDVLVVANFSGKALPAFEVPFPCGGAWRVRLNGDAKKYAGDFQDTPCPDVQVVGGRGRVGLGAWSVVVLSQ